MVGARYKCLVCKTSSRIPTNQDEQRKWFSLLGLVDNPPSIKNPRICANHFEADDFYSGVNGQTFLKKGTLPKDIRPVVVTEPKPNEPALDDSCVTLTDGLPIMKQETFLTEICNKEVPFLETDTLSLVGSSKSDTASASSTEREILKIMGENSMSLSRDDVGLESEFRGTLGLLEKPAQRKRGYIGDLTGEDFGTPRKRQRNLQLVKEVVYKQRSKINTLQATVRRLRNKITNLNSLIQHLKRTSMITESAGPMLKASLDGQAAEIFKRFLKGHRTQKYNESLRSFALTLAFYSARAYSFVRKTFNKSLPDLRTISRWYSTVDGRPGFTAEALIALKLKTNDGKEQLLCNLVMDEMSIRQQVELRSGGGYTGYVDVGNHMDSDELPEATQVLQLMLVCLNENWKIPVGYFLCNGISGSEKAALVKKCLEFVHPSGVIVTSLTFDGASSNISMAQNLGAQLSNTENLDTSFKHPVTNEDVFIFYDVCHMIKLIRNCFATFKVLKNPSNHTINWDFISKLVNKQNLEGLHAATKVRLRHLQWANEKMRVRLATQTLSKSVSDALLFLAKDLKCPDFKDAEATADFVLKFNNLFDIFNSRSKFAKYFYKRPLSQTTQKEFLSYMDSVKNYISQMKTMNGVSVLNCSRKTGFLGFLINIKSLKEMYQKYVIKEKKNKYITTYKLSQDHLELFFGAVRSKGGYNNNPTAKQYEAAYKRLIVKSEISGPNSGNVINLQKVGILTCGSGTISRSECEDNLENRESFTNLETDIQASIERHIIEYDFFDSPNWDLTLYTQDIVGYISGFVVKKLKASITCLKCLEIIQTSESPLSKLQVRKTYGKLIKASDLVIHICKAAEKFFRFFSKTNNIFNKNFKDVSLILISNTMGTLSSSIFDSFGDHLFDGGFMDGHEMLLPKLILKHYFKLRIFHETFKKLEATRAKKLRIRSQNTKLITFQNQ